ncbi:kinase-like protein, partial [Peniophora sp. CONT]
QHEAAMLDKVSGHPHIVPYMGMAHARSKCYVLTGLCEGGSLSQHIEAGDFHLRNPEVRRVFLQLLSAVKHSHQRGVAHRDLKPDNILALDKRAQTYCLADFGIASDRKQHPVELSGTFAYMAPECLGSEYWKRTYDTHAADVWSLGIILVKMITGRVPWKVAVGTQRNGDELYREYLRDRFFIGDYLELAEEFLPLLHRILEPTPSKRISIDDLEKEFKACKRFSWSIEEI